MDARVGDVRLGAGDSCNAMRRAIAAARDAGHIWVTTPGAICAHMQALPGAPA